MEAPEEWVEWHCVLQIEFSFLQVQKTQEANETSRLGEVKEIARFLSLLLKIAKTGDGCWGRVDRRVGPPDSGAASSRAASFPSCHSCRVIFRVMRPPLSQQRCLPHMLLYVTPPNWFPKLSSDLGRTMSVD